MPASGTPAHQAPSRQTSAHQTPVHDTPPYQTPSHDAPAHDAPAQRQAILILAGGSARRMGGGDKPLLRIMGQTILARIIHTLGPADFAISANGDPARFAGFGFPVLPDGMFAGQGPLAGLLAGLDWAAGCGAETLLTVPGDTPFVPPHLAAALAPAPACAASGGRIHHLVALWPIGCRAGLRAMLSAPGRRNVARFADMVEARAVDFPCVPWDPFLNVNTGDDLAMAHALARNLDTGSPP